MEAGPAASNAESDRDFEELEEIDDPLGDDVRWDDEIELHVSSADTATPISSAEVRVLVSWRPEEFRAGVTDRSGKVKLTRCSRGAVVWIRAPGYVVHAEEIDSTIRQLQVQLNPGRPVVGRVLHRADESPIANAEVYVWDEFTGDEIDYRPDQYGVLRDGGLLTDHDGNFRIAGLPEGRPVVIATRASGFGVATCRMPPSDPTGDVVLHLGVGASLEGTVTDRAGVPVKGVHVYALPVGDTFGFRHPDSRWFAGRSLRFPAFAQTDDAGRYRIEGLATPARLVPVAKGVESALAKGDPATLTGPEARARRDIRMIDPAWLTIRGFAPDGSPLTPKDCDLLHRDGTTVDSLFGGSSSYTRGSGSYSLHTRAPGKWLLVADAGLPWLPARVNIELAEGEVRTIDVHFLRGLTVRGVVHDSSGKSVPYARVVARDKTIRRSVRADDQGAFRLEGLRAGVLEFEAWDRAGYLTPAVIQTDISTSERVRIVLHPRPVITGQITPATGGEGWICALIRTATAERITYATPKADGTFRLPLSPMEPADVLFRDQEGRSSRWWHQLQGRVGYATDLGEIRLSESRAVSGVVRGEDGEPLPFALVGFRDWGRMKETHTDRHGLFELTHVPPQSVEVLVRAEGHVSLHAPLHASETALTLRCRAGTRVRGRLLDDDPARVTGRTLGFTHSSGRRNRMSRHDAVTDSVGRFEIRLFPGSYDVWTVRRGTRFAHTSITRERERLDVLVGRIVVGSQEGADIRLGLSGD